MELMHFSVEVVASCLVEPLVRPLVPGRGGGGGGPRPGSRTALRGKLAATALACSMLMAVTTNATASELLEAPEAPRVHRNAHAKPDPIPSHERLAEVARREDDIVARPALAPEFEWDAVEASRRRHARDIVRDTGPGLGLGRRLDRLTAVLRSFLLFSSGWHHSGAPNPAFI